MKKVKVTELREHLPDFLSRVNAGEELAITSRGRVIARLVPAEDTKAAARERLEVLRQTCKVGDVVSPAGVQWDAMNDRS